jgi:hypothetical protein
MTLFAGKVSPMIEVIGRLGAVKRWHIIDTTRVQTLAEHSAVVAMLAGEIARQLGHDPLPYIHWGLYHDVAETVVGDVPTPAKTLECRDIEESVLSKLCIRPASPGVAAIVKICDLAEALRFIQVHAVDHCGEWAITTVQHALHDTLRALSDDNPDGFETICAVLDEFIFDKPIGTVFPPSRYLLQALS